MKSQSVAPGIEPIDLGALVAAELVALWSFHSAFSGLGFFVAGAVGVAVGAAYWTLALRSSAPAWLSAIGAVVVFALVGPVVAVRGNAVAGFLPGLSAVGALFSGAVFGWNTLVTTLPPVGQAGRVLVVPYLCGFVGASASIWLLRSRVRQLAALPPVAVLGLGVLVGTDRAGSLFVEGGVLLAILLLWASTLDHRNRLIIGSAHRGRALVGSIALLGVVALLAGVVGSHVPFTHSRARYVLRDHVQPPFDATQYPSPLAAFRIYRVQTNKTKPLLTVDGLQTKTRLRLAVMDDYDGLVWRVGSADQLDTFRRTGTRLPAPAAGKTQDITVKIDADGPQGVQQVWTPMIGEPSRIEFHGRDSGPLSDGLRYNAAQQTAAEPGGLHSGDAFTLQTVVASDPAVDGEPIPAVPSASDESLFDGFSDKAGAIVKSASDPRAEATAIMNAFRQGYYDDGTVVNTPPGHFLARINEFLREPRPVGDAEQYAAAAAILLRARQVDARVVLGVILDPEKHDYQFNDVTAWVEIPVTGKGWVAYDVTPDTTRKPQPQPIPQQKGAGPQPPPQPPRAALAASSGSVDSAQSKSRHNVSSKPPHKSGASGLLVRVAGVAAIPILVFGGPSLIILSLKRRRRRKRRSAPSPAQQIRGGWEEVVDLLRDLGCPVPETATRRELIVLASAGDLEELAHRVDSAMFDAPEPSAEDARSLWDQVTSARRRMTRSIGRFDRIRCALSMTSLRIGQ